MININKYSKMHQIIHVSYKNELSPFREGIYGRSQRLKQKPRKLVATNHDGKSMRMVFEEGNSVEFQTSANTY